MGKIFKNKKGFTLIEVITVCVIIGIAASIAVPNFTNAIHRTTVRNMVQSAVWAENAIMSLTGLQYARSESGNPPIVDWGASPPVIVDSENYVYIQKNNSAGPGGSGVFRVAPANIAVPNRVADRNVEASSISSAGLKEFYKRTMNPLPPPTWRSAAGFEQWVTCSVYFKLEGSNINASVTDVNDNKFVSYDFAYSEYYLHDGNRQLVIYHGIKLHGTADKPGAALPSPAPTPDEGWHVYEYNGGNLTYFGSVS